MDKLNTERKRKKVSIRAAFDCLMGIIYFSVGVFLIFAESLGYKLHFPPQEFAMIFGIIVTVYGLFRCYRGYLSLYPEEE